MRLMSMLLILITPMPLLAQHSTEQKAAWQEGVHYLRLETPGPESNSDAIEIVEAFSYFCPHCFSFQQPLHQWLEQQSDVKLTRLPVALGHASWHEAARMYYAADALDLVTDSHMAIFKAIHSHRINLADRSAQQRFFAEYGVSAADWQQAIESFAVDTRVRRSAGLASSYQLSGTPSIIVGGRYVTSPRMAGGMIEATEVIAALVAMERERRAQTSSESP